MNVISGERDVKGAAFSSLLEFLGRAATTFSLVWPTRAKHRRSLAEVEGALAPFQVAERETHDWPGTHRVSPPALVRTYSFTVASRDVLLTRPSLFAWEDIAFYDRAGSVILGSVSHEELWWLETGHAAARTVAALAQRIAEGGSRITANSPGRPAQRST